MSATGRVPGLPKDGGGAFGSLGVLGAHTDQAPAAKGLNSEPLRGLNLRPEKGRKRVLQGDPPVSGLVSVSHRARGPFLPYKTHWTPLYSVNPEI